MPSGRSRSRVPGASVGRSPPSRLGTMEGLAADPAPHAALSHGPCRRPGRRALPQQSRRLRDRRPPRRTLVRRRRHGPALGHRERARVASRSVRPRRQAAERDAFGRCIPAGSVVESARRRGPTTSTSPTSPCCPSAGSGRSGSGSPWRMDAASLETLGIQAFEGRARGLPFSRTRVAPDKLMELRLLERGAVCCSGSSTEWRSSAYASSRCPPPACRMTSWSPSDISCCCCAAGFDPEAVGRTQTFLDAHVWRPDRPTRCWWSSSKTCRRTSGRNCRLSGSFTSAMHGGRRWRHPLRCASAPDPRRCSAASAASWPVNASNPPSRMRVRCSTASTPGRSASNSRSSRSTASSFRPWTRVARGRHRWSRCCRRGRRCSAAAA